MREHYIPSSNRHGGPKSSARGNSAAIRSFLLFSHRFPPFRLSASLSVHSFCHRFISPLPFPSTPCTIDDDEEYKASRGQRLMVTWPGARGRQRMHRLVSKCARKTVFLSLSSCFISYLSVPPFLFRVFLIIKIYDFRHLTREELVYLEISLQFIPRDRISRDVLKNFHRSPRNTRYNFIYLPLLHICYYVTHILIHTCGAK